MIIIIINNNYLNRNNLINFNFEQKSEKNNYNKMVIT